MTSADVLIVEDEPVVLLVAGKALTSYGISHVEATSYDSAAEALAAASFKVVLTDLKLPGASGFAVIELASSLSLPPPVITITGYATIENALDSFQLGSFDFLPKPFDVEELIAVVERALRYSDHPDDRPSRVGPSSGSRSEILSMGLHSWARLESDGTAVLGLGDSFAGVIDPIAAIDWIQNDGRIIQGAPCCRLKTANGRMHSVRAPLSGEILTTNPDLQTDPNLPAAEPYSDGWLLRIIPDNLEEEAPRLLRRASAGDA